MTASALHDAQTQDTRFSSLVQKIPARFFYRPRG